MFRFFECVKSTSCVIGIFLTELKVYFKYCLLFWQEKSLRFVIIISSGSVYFFGDILPYIWRYFSKIGQPDSLSDKSNTKREKSKSEKYAI